MNRGFERGHALKGAPPNPPGRDGREEAFHLIEPARTRRREMQVIPRMADEPADDLRRSMRAVVIHDHVDIAVPRQLRVVAIDATTLSCSDWAHRAAYRATWR